LLIPTVVIVNLSPGFWTDVHVNC